MIKFPAHLEPMLATLVENLLMRRMVVRSKMGRFTGAFAFLHKAKWNFVRGTTNHSMKILPFIILCQTENGCCIGAVKIVVTNEEGISNLATCNSGGAS